MGGGLPLLHKHVLYCLNFRYPFSSRDAHSTFLFFPETGWWVGETFSSLKGGTLMLPTCFYTWESVGMPVEFLSCLFLSLIYLCVLGNLLNSLPISSAARQMCFTGQFVVPSLFLHKWLPVVRVIRVIPPNFWCLSKILKFRVWAPSGGVKREDKLLKSTVCPCLEAPFQTAVFFCGFMRKPKLFD